jgi:hypothetical protein
LVRRPPRETWIVVVALLVCALTPTAASAEEIRGTVTNEATGAPVWGACVRAHSGTDNSVVALQGTDSGGHFFMNTLPPGQYAISFRSGNNAGCGTNPPVIVSEYFANKPDFAQSTKLNLSTGSLIEIFAQVAVLTTGTISGAVTNGLNQGLGGVCVSALSNASTVVAQTKTSGTGTYALTGVPAGTHRVAFTTDPTNPTCAGATTNIDGEYYNNKPFAFDVPSFNGADGVTVAAGAETSGINAKVNVRPVAADDAPGTITEDAGATEIDVLANDTDPDGGDALAISSPSDPPGGTATVVGAAPPQRIAYTPDANFCGADSFTYAVTGGRRATVSVNVVCADDAPTAVGDLAMASEDGGAQALDVLANDTDVDGGAKSVASKTDGSNGTVAVTDGGAGVTYAPNANFCGSDSFGYALSGGSAGTVNITVTCVDDDPLAVTDSRTVAEDAPAASIDVLANDTDIDDGARVVASATDAPHGTVTNTASTVSYRPDPDYCGPDSFTYALNGGSSATVAMTVTCVDDAVPDTTVPQTTITKAPKKRLTIRTARVRVAFRFKSSEPGSRFRCKLDGRPWKACASPRRYRLKPGRHVFRTRATDFAGNTDPTPAKRTVRVRRRPATPPA